MVDRKPLGTYPLTNGRMVAQVEVQRLTLPPGGKTGLHRHPCPVISFILEGSVTVQVLGEDPRTFTVGQTVFEPADTAVQSFDNASDSTPAVFIATYLLGAEDRELIHMLE
jgi:quercetin dioxygenase-like cupin family protein